MTRKIQWWLASMLGLCTLLTGCPASVPPQEPAAQPGASTAVPAAAVEPTAQPGLEPFTPPSLEELDAKAKWFSQPVEDSLELLRKYQTDHPAQTTVAEALALGSGRPTLVVPWTSTCTPTARRSSFWPKGVW